jgi:hypothetical protein
VSSTKSTGRGDAPETTHASYSSLDTLPYKIAALREAHLPRGQRRQLAVQHRLGQPDHREYRLARAQCRPIERTTLGCSLVGLGRSYRLVGREVGLSKNTVAGIVKRARTTPAKS